MLQVASPPAEGQLSLLINYHKNDSSCQYPTGTAGSQREITGLPAFAAARRPSRGLAPRSVRIKDLYFRTDRVLRTSTGARPARPEWATHGRPSGPRPRWPARMTRGRQQGNT